MKRSRWALQPDGSYAVTIGGARLTVFRRYEDSEAWWQTIQIGTWRWLSGSANVRWNRRGAMLRARWALRTQRPA